jgi:hypothetical protein
MNGGVEKTALRAASLCGLVICVVVGVWAWRMACWAIGAAAGLVLGAVLPGAVFGAFQRRVQVVGAHLSGGLGCSPGVLLLRRLATASLITTSASAWGSLLAFAIARNAESLC